MDRIAKRIVVALLVAAAPGCVERRFLIESNVPGALVYQNGQQLGATPLEVPFLYYGKYEFELVKEGYETEKFQTRVRAPWFEWVPFDFFAENVWPWHIQDNRPLRFDLLPQKQPRTEDLLEQARLLQERAAPLRENPPMPDQ